jgi:methyl-accepting chemotaxis protein
MSLLTNLKLSRKLTILISVAVLLLIILGVVNIISLNKNITSLKTIYNDRVIPLQQLKEISDLYAVNIVDATHKTRNGNWSWEEGANNINIASKKISEIWKVYKSTFLTDKEKLLIKDAELLFEKANSSIRNSEVIFKEQNLEKLAEYTKNELYQNIDPITNKISELITLQLEVSKFEYENGISIFNSAIIINIILIFFSIILLLFLGILLIRNIINQLGADPLEVIEITNRVSNGDLTIDIDLRKLDKSSLLYKMDLMIKSIKSMTNDVNEVVENSNNGRLLYRSDVSKHNGEFKSIISGLNGTLDAFTNIMNSASNLMIADSEGRIGYINLPVTRLLTKYEANIQKEYPSFALNKLVGANIDMFHKKPAYNRDLLQNLTNNSHSATISIGEEIFRLVINPLNNSEGKRLGYVVQWNNVTNQSKFDNNLRSIIEQITVGNLNSRFNVNLFDENYKDMASSINMMIDGIVNPLKVTADYLDRISVGNIPNKITDMYMGDFNNIKISLNKCIDSLNGIIDEMNYMSHQHDLGDIDVWINVNKFTGAYQTMVKGVNDMVNGHLAVNKKALNCFEEFGNGNLNAIVENFPGKKAFINVTIEKVRANIKELINDSLTLSKAAEDGKLDIRADITKHNGDFKAIINGFNKTLDNIIGPLNVAAENIAMIAKGDMPAIITDKYNGDFNEIKNNLNTLIHSLNHVTNIANNISKGNLDDEINRRSENDMLMISLQTMKISINSLISDVNSLANSAQSGILDKRADSHLHQGEYRNIIEGINRMFDTIVEPINESINVLESLADGDLTVSIKGNYQGDLFKLKKALNDSIESISDVITQVKTTVDEVSSGALQVSDASTALSQGATEQAASLEEITSSMTEIGSQTKTNAENANQANILTTQAKIAAEKGADEMNQLNKAMKEISESSKNISKIIKVIDEIAFQTNLLALNAAVEAARAGRHGKGFAVVAEEVRNLAARSATAAKETSDMIENSIKLVENGSSLANKTSEALDGIKLGNIKAADIVGEIATASDEQAQGIAQINEGLIQIDKVTQTNTASAEESASASEELSGQANMLKNMVSKFMILEDSHYRRTAYDNNRGVKMISSQRENPRRLSSHYQNEHSFANPRPEDIIKLDEDDFGRY